MEDLEELLKTSIGPVDVQEKILNLAMEDPSMVKPEFIQLLNYARYARVHSKPDKYPTPSKVVISTVSSTGSIADSRVLDLRLLVEKLEEDIGEEGYFIESIGVKKRKSDSSFGNSINIKLRGCPDRKIVNVILSQNGKITLTGADDLEYGKTCMERLIEEIKFFPETFYNVSPETLCIGDYAVTLINTDFNLGFEIDQIRLYEILIQEYSYLVTFNPEVYPGVSVHLMYQDGKGAGLCNCMPNCISKNANGSGNGENNCREITCNIFQTGKVIITASTNMTQLNAVYDYINDLLKTHYEEIVVFSIKDFPTNSIVEVN